MKFPKDICDSMRSCILAIFWPKDDIIDFFKQSGCTSREFKEVKDYKELNISRAKIIDIVFDSLHRRSDGGLGQFRGMLQALINWNHFDPYYFNKLKKLNEEEARRQINHLKQLQEIRDAKIKKKKEERLLKEHNSQRVQTTREELKEEFLNFFSGKDRYGNNISPQERGYLFEQFLIKLFKYETLYSDCSFKLNGEQIDGSLKFDGENYIIEAKWQDSFIATNSLYQFAYKVEGKLYGRGIFFSVNGYSPGAIEQLKQGKALNTILIDGADLTFVVEGRYSFKELLNKKIRAAQTMGRIYVDVSTMNEKY